MEYKQIINQNLNINQFYSLRSKLSSSTFQVHAVNLNINPVNLTSDYEKLMIGDFSNISFPVIFKHKYGTKLEDILDTGHWLMVISNRIKNALVQNNIKGITFYDVIILDKQDNLIDGYCGLSVTGKCGKIDNKKSEIIEKKLSPNAPLTEFYKGLHVGLDTWDGSDFFLPENNFGIIVTKRVFDIFKVNKFSNVKLTNLSEIEILKY